MTRPVYFDDNCGDSRVIAFLVQRGIPALDPVSTGMSGRRDEEHLAFAAGHSYVLATSDESDFPRLHREWVAARRKHAGIIIVQQQRWDPGEIGRRLARAILAFPDDEWDSRIEYLGAWGSPPTP